MGLANLSTVAVSIVTCVVIYAVVFSWKKKPGTAVPCVSGYPIVGNFFDLGLDVIVERMRAHIKVYGNLFLLEVFGRKFFHVSDAQLCREILQKRPKQVKRGRNLESMAQVMGYLPNGLFHAVDPVVWSKMKKMIAPAFSKQNVQSMSCVFFNESMEMVQKLQARADAGEVVDMLREANGFTVNVINKVAFGNERVDYFFSEQFYDDTSLAFRVILESALFHFPRWVWKLTPMYQREQLVAQGNARLEAACREVIRRKRQQHAGLTEAEQKQHHGHDLIDIMLRQEGATDDEVLANVKTFYLAGSDTTSISISWAMLLLHRHPAAVAAVRAEVCGLFAHPQLQQQGETTTTTTTMSAQALAEAIAALPYTLAVLKEAIRLYPVGPMIFLDFTDQQEPLTLSNGVVIDSDNALMLHVWACHLDEANFPDAHSFRPERWLTEDKQALGRMEHAFLGFGAGPRACPGMGLALIEGVTALAALVHHFDFSLACPEEEVRVEFKFTMQPNKLPMKMSRRATAAAVAVAGNE